MSQTFSSSPPKRVRAVAEATPGIGSSWIDRLKILLPGFANWEFVSSCGISLALHVAGLFFLSFFVLDLPAQVAATLISTLQPVAEPPEPVVSLDAWKTDEVGQNVEGGEVSQSVGDMATVIGHASGDGSSVAATAILPDQLPSPSARLAQMEAIPQEAPLLSLLTTTGSAVTTNQGGTAGAIDRLTREIAASLRENRTCVFWLFDASLSLKDRRNEVADQFENVYRELGALELGAEGALTTAVASYGERIDILTQEPVEKIDEIKQAVREIPADESGKENVFHAVQEAVKRWNKYRLEPRRNALMVIVTDEKGDDLNQLEAAIQLCRKTGIRCYVLGNAALFGRVKGFVRWRYADGEVDELPVDQGPETAAPEAVQLGYWSTNGRDLERMSAAYGPYGLTRLCAETGGVYFIADESRVHRFDPEIMRNYLPDYRSLDAYEKDVKKSPMKMSLVAASTRTAAEEIPLPQLVFRADTDEILKQQLFEAQKPAADLDYKLNLMLEALEGGEKERARILEPRWQAGYDLALGRVLTMRVRAFGYNAVLAEMKTNPKKFADPGNNHWLIQPVDEISSGVQVKKMAAKGVALLEKVIHDHPGTPWELIARRELSQPLGWKWGETFYEIPKPREEGNNGTPRPPRLPPAPRVKPKL